LDIGYNFQFDAWIRVISRRERGGRREGLLDLKVEEDLQDMSGGSAVDVPAR